MYATRLYCVSPHKRSFVYPIEMRRTAVAATTMRQGERAWQAVNERVRSDVCLIIIIIVIIIIIIFLFILCSLAQNHAI